MKPAHLLGLSAAALVLTGSVASAGDAPEPSAPPFESEGDLHFFVDLAGFRGDERHTDQEIYLSITNDQLAFEEVEGGDGLRRGELRLSIDVYDTEGEEVHRIESTLDPEASSGLDAGDRGIVQIVRESLAVAPGPHRFDITLVDENALKTGLFNRMRNAKKSGSLSAWYEVPAYSGPELRLSSPALLRSYRPVADGVFGRNGIDFDPNPSRLYGLTLSKVSVYVEVYAGEAFASGDTFLVRSQILDRTESPVTEQFSRATPIGGSFVVTKALDLAGEVRAGSYLLDVTVMNKRTRETASSRRAFEVIWAVSSWAQDPDSMLQEMRLIMRESDFQTLASLAPGAREVFLAQFWKDLDPTPDTPENEVLIAFHQRVRYADAEFPSTLQRGIVTDRGRVWVRYGPPDDVDYRYSSSSIAGDLGAERVAGPGERASLGHRPNPSFLDTDEFQEGDVSGVAQQRGGSNIESKQLEIWSYDGHGNVLTDRQQLDATSHRGLKFIFADEMGDGNYVLIGSSGTTLY